MKTRKKEDIEKDVSIIKIVKGYIKTTAKVKQSILHAHKYRVKKHKKSKKKKCNYLTDQNTGEKKLIKVKEKTLT